MAVGVSLDDIQKIIGNKQEIPEGFLTAKQWAAELSVSDKKMLQVLGQLKESGCLEVGFKETVSLSNRRTSVPAYKINLPEKKKKGK